VDPPLN